MPTRQNHKKTNKKPYIIMSKIKKETRAAKRAAREEQQAKRVINWIVGGLIVLFVIAAVYAFLVQ